MPSSSPKLRQEQQDDDRPQVEPDGGVAAEALKNSRSASPGICRSSSDQHHGKQVGQPQVRAEKDHLEDDLPGGQRFLA
jgi:hypothetical protein